MFELSELGCANHVTFIGDEILSLGSVHNSVQVPRRHIKGGHTKERGTKIEHSKKTIIPTGQSSGIQRDILNAVNSILSETRILPSMTEGKYTLLDIRMMKTSKGL